MYSVSPQWGILYVCTSHFLKCTPTFKRFKRPSFKPKLRSGPTPLRELAAVPLPLARCTALILMGREGRKSGAPLFGRKLRPCTHVQTDGQVENIMYPATYPRHACHVPTHFGGSEDGRCRHKTHNKSKLWSLSLYLNIVCILAVDVVVVVLYRTQA